MNRTIIRRGPNTLLIYGSALSMIALTGAGLVAIGLEPSGSGWFVLAASAALILTPAVMRDPFGMVCLIVFLLPFSLGVLQVEIGIVTFNPYTLGILGGLLVAVAGIAMGKLRYRPTSEDLAVLLLGVSFLLSTLRARDMVEAGYLAFHGVFIPIVTYFVLKTLVRTSEQYRKVLVAYVVGITAFGVYGLVQFVREPDRLFILNMPPISAAALLTTALIIVIYSGWWRTLSAKVAVLVLAAALLATFSRGYLVLLLLTPLFFQIFRRGHATVLITGMLVASLVGTLLFVQAYEMFYVEGLDKEQEQTAERVTEVGFWLNSLYGRARYYAVGLEEFAKSPILGNGFHQGFVSPAGRAVVWHNFHVEWLEYGGIVAYLLYVIVLILHFRGMSHAAQSQRAIAVNLTAFFTVLLNGLTNSFTAGISPVLGFLFMALNRARENCVSGETMSAKSDTPRMAEPKSHLIGKRAAPHAPQRPASPFTPGRRPLDPRL